MQHTYMRKCIKHYLTLFFNNDFCGKKRRSINERKRIAVTLGSGAWS